MNRLWVPVLLLFFLFLPRFSLHGCLIGLNVWSRPSLYIGRRKQRSTFNRRSVSWPTLRALGAPDTTPGAALLASERTRKAADVILKLHHSKDGSGILHKLAKRTETLLRQIPTNRMTRGLFGQARLVEHDVEKLLGDRTEWGTLQPLYDTARESFWALVELLTLGTRAAAEVEVLSSSKDGSILCLDVRLHGESLRMKLAETEEREMWGNLSSYYVSEGPEAMVGRRLVAHLRCHRPCEEVELEVQVGDVLALARADRAAFILIAAFDRLPDFAVRPSPLHRQKFRSHVLANAREFAYRLQEVGTVQGRVQARLQRLTESLVVQEVLNLAAKDETWRDALDVLQPYVERLYVAGAEAGGRFEGVEVSINMRRMIAYCLVGLAIAGGLSELGKLEQLEADRNLPLYTSAHHDSVSDPRLAIAGQGRLVENQKKRPAQVILDQLSSSGGCLG